MRPRDLDSLGFPGVRRRVAELATSQVGKRRCLTLQPSIEANGAVEELETAERFARLIATQGHPPISAFPDVAEHLRQASLDGFVASGEALVEVRAVLDCIHRCRRFFSRLEGNHRQLAAIAEDLPDLEPVREALERSLDHDGSVLDQASDELAAVRAAIRRLRNTLSRRLHDLVGKQSMSDVVSDQYVTIRNDRFVIPVKAGSSSRVQGVVQDRSVSGETFFVEPLFAVELNNDLLNAVRDEQAAVRRVLADLTSLVRRESEAIAAAVEKLAAIDCAAARGRFAIEYDCARPVFSDGEITLRNARHPGLLFTGRPVTPIDILLPSDKRALVITGPNTGGKTVALKTLGLFALMAQSGILIPVDPGATLPLFERVFTDVGDEQNIERDLSTFSAHVVNLREILDQPPAGSLILLDEPGVGTDPEEGAALAVGLLRHLEQRASRVVVTTHYRSVKLYAVSSEACQVAAVDFEVATLEPHYQLIYHSLGRSMALPIAERLGLPSPVLELARQAQSEDTRTFNEALERLEASRRELESERAGLRSRRQELDTLAAEVGEREAEAKKLVETLRERKQRAWKDELRNARDFVRELKDKGRSRLRKNPAESADFAAFVREQEAQIREHEKALAPPPVEPAAAPGVTPSRPRPGDTVEVGTRGIRGELLSIEGERAWIQRGTLRFEVPTAQLTKVGRKRRVEPEVRISRSVESVSSEITLVGLRARQALEKLEGFLDRAAQTDQDSVRIIHGVGSGALRRAVRDYLSTSPYCSAFRAGEDGEGGAGVTVAVLAAD